MRENPDLPAGQLQIFEKGIKVMKTVAAKTLHNVLLQRVRATVRKEAMAKFDSVAEAFQANPAMESLPTVLDSMRALSQSQHITPPHEKLVHGVAHGSLTLVHQMPELFLHDDGTVLYFDALTDLFSVLMPILGKADAITKEVNGCGAVLRAIMDLHEANRVMLNSEDYITKLPVVEQCFTKGSSLAEQVSQRARPELAALAGTPFDTHLTNFIKTVERDIGKAKEVINRQYDSMFHAKVSELGAIAGGAPNGKVWCDGAGAADVAAVFETTLEKVNQQQIVDKFRAVGEGIEEYTRCRGDDADRAAVLKVAASTLLRARVTQLESQIFKTAKKSKKPVERITTLLSGFDTETHYDGRHAAFDCISDAVATWLDTKFDIRKTT